MRQTIAERAGRALLALSLLLLLPTPGLRAGEMEPPAAPGPTLKALNEVEPRITILPGSLPLSITAPGSYYFSSDLEATGDGILVDADDVTIDLMGYTLRGPGKGSGVNHGIHIFMRDNVEIRNGTVREFGSHGIWAEDGPMGPPPRGQRVIDLRALENGQFGIYLEADSNEVRHCSAIGNGYSGIHVEGQGSTVAGNTAASNGRHGIYAVSATVLGNAVSKNQESGIVGYYGCLIADNIAHENNLSDSTTEAGIKPVNGSLVRGNTVRFNHEHNILVDSSWNTVEGNLLLGSKYGIRFSAGYNLYAGNRATNHSVTDYSPVANVTDGGGNFSF